MSKVDYWMEAISNAFEANYALEAWKSLSEETKELIAAEIEIAHDNYGMAFYSPPPSDQMINERRSLQQQIDALRKERDEWQNAFEKNVANRWNVELNQVIIRKDGSAEVWK